MLTFPICPASMTYNCSFGFAPLLATIDRTLVSAGPRVRRRRSGVKQDEAGVFQLHQLAGRCERSFSFRRNVDGLHDGPGPCASIRPLSVHFQLPQRASQFKCALKDCNLRSRRGWPRSRCIALCALRNRFVRRRPISRREAWMARCIAAWMPASGFRSK